MTEQRPVLIFRRGTPLTCLNGHRLHHTVIEQSVVVCHKEMGDWSGISGECGQVLYLCRRDEEGSVLVTRIDDTERQLLDRSALSPWEIWRILGFTL